EMTIRRDLAVKIRLQRRSPDPPRRDHTRRRRPYVTQPRPSLSRGFLMVRVIPDNLLVNLARLRVAKLAVTFSHPKKRLHCQRPISAGFFDSLPVQGNRSLEIALDGLLRLGRLDQVIRLLVAGGSKHRNRQNHYWNRYGFHF